MIIVWFLVMCGSRGSQDDRATPAIHYPAVRRESSNRWPCVMPSRQVRRPAPLLLQSMSDVCGVSPALYPS